MKDERNYHQRLQEFCDCFMETDLMAELKKASQGLSGDPSGDLDEGALKFLGLAILYGASERVNRIVFHRSKEGKVRFEIEGEGKYQLPAPSPQMAERIIAIGRSMTHIEDDHGVLPVSMGLRNDRVDLRFELDRRGEEETLSIAFPTL